MLDDVLKAIEMRPELEPHIVEMVEQYPVGARITQPIQQLALFCSKENLESPVFLVREWNTFEILFYKLILQDEPMQGPLFLVKCRVGDVEFSGSCTTKKSAKRAAAFNVYSELKKRRLTQPEALKASFFCSNEWFN
jgi:dsRNA-specific ribonuclease